MEKKNSNVIARNDGKQYLGYISDLQMLFAEKVQTNMNALAHANDSDDELFKETQYFLNIVKDLAGYTEKDNTLVKVTKYENGGYWIIDFIY